MTAEITIDEIMVTCISRQIIDGETVAQGIATPLVAAGYLLARHTHAPQLYFASAIGQSMCRYPAPLGLTNVEQLWLDRSLSSVGFVRAVTEVLPTLKPKEFFRPGQIDCYGNTNNIAFGRKYVTGGLPRMRLPGTGGIPDVTTYIDKIYLYVPRHSKITFVSILDIASGLGHSQQRMHGQGPCYLVSDLGQFDFANGQMRLISNHPGVTIERIMKRTGFELEIAPDIQETSLPTQEEIDLLRLEIDPLRIRALELLTGNDRRKLLHTIIEEESYHL
jgi:acyl CoA:acetate/3-ketoacid CoA transferase beta subunit